MKLACFCFIVFLISLASANANVPAPDRIAINSTLESTRFSNGTRVRKYLLWNYSITPRPIGHAFSSCATGPGNISICTTIYTLPLGRIISVAEIHDFRRFYATVVGGSQSARARAGNHPGYSDASGIVLTQRVGPGTNILTFVLDKGN